MTDTKIRCSDLDTLMTKPKAKKDEISATAMSLIKELWIMREFGREKYIQTKYMLKGIEQENSSIQLLNSILSKEYQKNEKFFENDFITGTPDIIGDEIIDIKSSWDLWTFASIDEKTALKTYRYQLLGYMWLTGIKKAKLAYCLVDTPEHMFVDEMYKLTFTHKDLSQEQLEAKFYDNYHFSDIPKEKRVKIYNVEWSDEEIEGIKNKVLLTREIMKGMSL
jgi:hypothetical protein